MQNIYFRLQHCCFLTVTNTTRLIYFLVLKKKLLRKLQLIDVKIITSKKFKMSQEEQSDHKSDSDTGLSFKVKAGIFLTSVAGMSAIIGFGGTLAAVKKQDSKYFNKGVVGSLEMSEPGVSLAMRALGWGTLYAFAGCGILFFSIWKLSGAKTMEEFRYTMGNALPRIRKNDPPQGRTEFSGMTDLLAYLSSPESSNRKKE